MVAVLIAEPGFLLSCLAILLLKLLFKFLSAIFSRLLIPLLVFLFFVVWLVWFAVRFSWPPPSAGTRGRPALPEGEPSRANTYIYIYMYI